ncbi:hypothetical protein [Enterococcus caccae]|uniref:MucBP domain-containing protein n=1 Tax=Enterococcus caccae ATCC BAA-1240 TaxID=1158612 RepID=R3WRB9_9ENTE|nr:hypothetical protein [Enterococcus caccae]EOL49937.1 hypothetical protein UC7_00602 [Enterococcus caccae ATCC BAA-1240]EOT56277.1 hypothetical protein I580_03077 [Enterococcus caccae ATCC BAA-1240]OJG26543.1 hypothetical protein RU98_GL000599 [Enterococcus caccae]
MNSPKKKIVGVTIGVALLGIVLLNIMFKPVAPILASPDKKSEKSLNKPETNKESVDEQNSLVKASSSLRALDPVENPEGLKATPKVFTLAKNTPFPNLTTEAGRKTLFSELVIPNPQFGAHYEYVTADGSPATPSSAETGFKLIYVEITESYSLSSIRVPIPVTITDTSTTLLLDNQVGIQTSNVNGKIILYPDEVKNKTAEQLQQLVKTRSNVKAWSTETGEEVAVDVLSTTIATKSVGTYKAEFEVTLGSETGEKKATTQRDVLVFGADIKAPNYFTIVQKGNLAMGTNAASIFSKYQTLSTTTASNATYEWVADEAGTPTVPVNKFDSSNTGFHWAYIKMTEKTNTAVSTVIPIPVTVTLENQTVIVSSKVGVSYDVPILKVSETKGKTIPQIISILTQKISLKAWDTTTGENLDARITSSSINSSSRGKNEVVVTVVLGTELLKQNISVLVVPDAVLGAADIQEWQNLPLNSTDGVITNPINGSKIGFLNRGLTDSIANDVGFRIQDQSNRGYVYSAGTGRVATIPGVNNQVLYRTIWERTAGLGWSVAATNISTKYFLRKGNELKEVLVDETNNIMYVYNLSISRNLNFSVKLDMYNLSNTTKSFSMLESVDTDYYVDSVPIYALRNNSGFYMQPSSGNRFTVKLKDGRGNWLSDYSKYIAGAYSLIGVSQGTNYFGNSFLTNGTESRNYSEGQVIASGVDSGYQLGAPWKNIAPDEALKTGYEVFAGQEIPYMQLKANPEVFNIYSDSTEELKTDYKLSKIPTVNEQGTIYVTYPNGEEARFPFASNNVKEFDGSLTIPLSTLPKQENEKYGSIHKYETLMQAVDETDSPMNGLPSQDYSIKVNVYKLGGTPIAQTIRKDSVWSKTAQGLIKDPIVMVGHTATFEYVNPTKPVDTSKVGLQYAEVRMTDKQDPSQTTVIKVPVMVVEGTPPTSGLIIGAEDIAVKKAEVLGLTDEQLKSFILKKSGAIAWDVATGLSEGVELSITETSLTNDPDTTKTHTATIQAKKGTTIKTTTIQIRVNAKLTVNFLDENGNPLHEAYTDVKALDTTVDLTKITAITDILNTLKEENYDLVKKPDNEIMTIVDGENKVSYQFNGSLKILSAPDVLDFETKKATINAVKFKDPKIIGNPLVVSDTRADKVKWNLKAKVDQPLTSLEDERVKLPDSIKYKYQEDELTLTDESSVIFSHLNTVSGRYDITQERWSKGDGFMLDLAPGAIKALGKYQAQITITLENAK